MNLEHMRTTHGLFIPDPEMVADMQSFVGYLATEVREWHECLYCGATKPSTLSIQSHMRDKGHCLLNLDREPELLDFWERPLGVDGDVAAALEEEGPINLSATEIRFASGRVIGSRHAATATKKASRKRGLMASTMRALPPGSEDAESSPPAVEPQLEPGRQLARREEMGMLGVSVQQRQALVLAEKKAQRSEAVARRAREWAYGKRANSQKFDQIDNQMKWGKQNHKLLPR
jgi:pre-60S factor REI1